jgi:hypothetical protein
MIILDDEKEERTLADLKKEEKEEIKKLPFAYAEVNRLMKKYLDKDKQVEKRVKIELNKFLGRVLETVCTNFNNYPYATVRYDMLKESIYVYDKLPRITDERERLLKTLDMMESTIGVMKQDIIATMKLMDVEEKEVEE